MCHHWKLFCNRSRTKRRVGLTAQWQTFSNLKNNILSIRNKRHQNSPLAMYSIAFAAAIYRHQLLLGGVFIHIRFLTLRDRVESVAFLASYLAPHLHTSRNELSLEFWIFSLVKDFCLGMLYILTLPNNGDIGFSLHRREIRGIDKKGMELKIKMAEHVFSNVF